MARHCFTRLIPASLSLVNIIYRTGVIDRRTQRTYSTIDGFHIPDN